MDYRRENVHRKVHPRDKANTLSLLTFFYVIGFYIEAYKKSFEENTLPKITKKLKSSKCGNDIELQWKNERRRHIKPSIIRLILREYSLKFGMYSFILLSWKLIRGFLEPPAMLVLIGYFREGQTQYTKTDAVTYGALVLVLNLLDSIILRDILFFTQEICMKLRSGISSLIYRKILKLKLESLNSISIGNIVTLITKDIGILEEAINTIHAINVGTAQIWLLCYMLFIKLGLPSIGGIAFFLVTLLIQILMGSIISKLRVRVDRISDQRLQTTKQAISAIKLIKIYLWEDFFYSKITKLRRSEMKTMLKEVFLRFLLKVVGSLCVSLSIYVLIMTHIWLGYTLTTEVVFYILGCFRQINILLVRALPGSIGKFAELYGACSRIEKMLNSDELEAEDENISINPSVILKNVYVDFGGKAVLENISLQIESGLVCLSGSVGSGKSSLLKTILLEYPIKSGALKSLGRISYASQDPWIFPSTIRQNIIFGNSFDVTKYKNIVRACALEYDFKQLERGDGTVLLENGANLSKGQQIRINLARALYKDAEIYLLDDCLSSLDPKVSQFIFYYGIKAFLKDKICLFATHDSSHIDSAKSVIILEHGRIKFFGKSTAKSIKSPTEHPLFTESLTDSEDLDEQMEYSDHTKLVNKENGTYFEDVVQGKLHLQYYLKYIQFGRGYCIFIIIILFYFLNQISQSFSTKFLTQWADEENTVILLGNNTSSTVYEEAVNTKNHTFFLYSIFTFSTVLLSLIKTFGFFDFARVASLKAHGTTLKSVLNAEMTFFDTHLIGNILNRFSNDINNVDELLPHTGNEFLIELVSMFGILLLISLVKWTFAIPMILILIVIYLMKVFCLHAVLSLKRLESSTRAPVVGQLNATLDGLLTVKTSRCQKLLIEEFDDHLDQFTCVHYSTNICIQALSMFTDLIILALMCLFMVYFLVSEHGISSGNVGLVLVQIFTLNGHVQYGMRMWTTMQSNVTSVERLFEYSTTKQENRNGNKLDSSSNLDSVHYSKVYLTYPDSKKMILKNINVTIEPKDKVGLIGRTGSGKSTFVSALFRLYNFQGKILINGVDIKSLNLNALRHHIDLIPQNAFLFTGTIRENLDPLKQFDDDKIWSILDELKLKYLIPNIDMPVLNEGSNFTTAEKQLICFARVLIRNKKIIIVDEITANVDQETELLIIDLIKKYFREKTVIIIAHRIRTILDCNKILVFHNGEIIEAGNRDDLLNIEKGYFSSIVKKMS